VRNYRFLIPILKHIKQYRAIWSLIELASLYTVPLSAVNRLTTTSNGQARPIRIESPSSAGTYYWSLHSSPKKKKSMVTLAGTAVVLTTDAAACMQLCWKAEKYIPSRRREMWGLIWHYDGGTAWCAFTYIRMHRSTRYISYLRFVHTLNSVLSSLSTDLSTLSTKSGLYLGRWHTTQFSAQVSSTRNWSPETCVTSSAHQTQETGTRMHGTRAKLLVDHAVSSTKNLGGELGSCAMDLSQRVWKTCPKLTNVKRQGKKMDGNSN